MLNAAGLQQEALGKGIVAGAQSAMPPVAAPVGTNTGAGLFASLSDNTKGLLAITGGQAAAGLLGGYFQGLSAEEQLEFQKSVEAWRQKNASYAPRVSFNRPGVLGRA